MPDYEVEIKDEFIGYSSKDEGDDIRISRYYHGIIVSKCGTSPWTLS
jgi:hypothetical protein